MSNVTPFENEFGLGVVIMPPDNLDAFEAACQELSDENLLDFANSSLTAVGYNGARLTSESVINGREGLLDLLIGMFAVGALKNFPK